MNDDSDDRSPDEQRLDQEIDRLLSALVLKDERRTGWQLRGIDRPESVAAHSWGVAYLCLLYAERAGVDPDRAVRLAVLHDLAEAETGDVPTRADIADEQDTTHKQDTGGDQDTSSERPTVADERLDPEAMERRERDAIRDLLGPFDGHTDRWEEYEDRSSPEARFVKDMDLIDMCLQALYYEQEGRYDPDDGRAPAEEDDRLEEFFRTAEPRLRTELGQALFETIRERYDRLVA